MSLVEHAHRELELCGQFREDPRYAQSIVAAVAAFASYGHSGGSAGVAVHQLTTLLQYGTLSELTADPQEWMEVGAGTWQSQRNPQAFSTDAGRTYYLLDEVDAARQAAADAAERPMHTSVEAADRGSTNLRAATVNQCAAPVAVYLGDTEVTP